MGEVILANLLAVIVLTAIVTLPALIVAYAVAELSKNRWRYSLRALLIITTLTAALLGLIYSLK
jgi:hypothetical protein